jgi:hypothetical protein
MNTGRSAFRFAIMKLASPAMRIVFQPSPPGKADVVLKGVANHYCCPADFATGFGHNLASEPADWTLNWA